MAKYLCPTCRKQLAHPLDIQKHKELVSKSKNGLVLYSDIHRCVNEILGVCNIRVDNDLNVRGFEYIKLPSLQNRVSKLGILVATRKARSDYPEGIVTNIVDGVRLKLIMSMKKIDFRLNVGNVNSLHDPVIDLLHSTNGDIDLYLCGSNLPSYDNLKVWLQVIIDLLDGTQPCILGLILESFKYIIENNDHLPQQKDVQILRMILDSYFTCIEDINQGVVSSLFKGGGRSIFKSKKGSGKTELSTIIKITDEIVKEPNQPILNLIKINPEHFMDIIATLIKLEEAGIIRMEGCE